MYNSDWIKVVGTGILHPGTGSRHPGPARNAHRRPLPPGRSHRHPAEGVIFEVVSAASNVGITTGFVNPGMRPAAKWLFILVMWAGRLEIVPVIALVFGAARRL